jgi:hypothetical protein
MKIKERIKKYIWRKIQSNNVIQWEDVNSIFYLNKNQIEMLMKSLYFIKQENEKDLNEIDLWMQLDKKIKQHHSGACLSFAQSGEDMVIRSLNRGKKNGFFVDIGAHHPIRFSNTFYFYLEGWTGINVDPIPGVMNTFEKVRPFDINLEIAVGQSGVSEFYQFEEGAYNTFDKQIAQKMITEKISPLLKIHTIKKIPLKEILEKYVPKKKSIDLLTIDAEGLDVEILQSNDWDRFRPEYVCAECHATDESRPMNPRRILEENGYRFVCQTEFSSIYYFK